MNSENMNNKYKWIWINDKKIKKLEKDISRVKYSLELVRTIVPVLVLFLQVVILARVI